MRNEKVQLLGIVLGATLLGAGFVLVGYNGLRAGPWGPGAVLTGVGAVLFLFSMWLHGRQGPPVSITKNDGGYAKLEPPVVLHSMHKIK